MQSREHAVIVGTYTQSSVRMRIEAFFLDNIGKVTTREQIMEVAIDPKTGRTPKDWHQRLSELRIDYGYTILFWRSRGYPRVSKYLMPSAKRWQDPEYRAKMRTARARRHNKRE